MFKRFLAFLSGWFEPTYRVCRVAEKPDRMAPRRVYVLGEEGDDWAAVFVCPCGCKADVWLNLLAHSDGRPTWTVEGREGAKVHINPSVWRQTGCRSHFFIRKGRVVWAGRA